MKAACISLHEQMKVLAENLSFTAERSHFVLLVLLIPSISKSPTYTSSKWSSACHLRACGLSQALAQALVVDEIATQQEAEALQGVVHRGPVMVGTAHGNTIHDLIKNPQLNLLLGGLSDVTVGDHTARSELFVNPVTYLENIFGEAVKTFPGLFHFD